MRIHHLTGAVSACLLMLFTNPTSATLVNNGNGLIYDTDLDITWLADANYAQTSGYDDDGIMTWDEPMTRVGQLTYGRQSGWRLPNAVPCGGNSCLGTGSELNDLFYN